MLNNSLSDFENVFENVTQGGTADIFRKSQESRDLVRERVPKDTFTLTHRGHVTLHPSAALLVGGAGSRYERDKLKRGIRSVHSC